MKIRTSHSPRMLFKGCKCGLGGSIIKGTLSEYKVHFSCTSASTGAIFLKIHTSNFPCAQNTRYKFVCTRSIINCKLQHVRVQMQINVCSVLQD